MRDYVIMTDSSCDLPAELAAELELTAVPLSICMDGTVYYNHLDGRDITPKDFFAQLRAGKMPTTSACSAGQFEEAMEDYLKQGKDILYLGFSTGLSTTYNSARLAAEVLSEKYPQARIETVDTLCAALGQGLIVYLAVQQKRSGKTLDEVRDFVETHKQRIHHWVMVDDLFHLKRGGRISATSAVLGSVLNVKPLIYVDEEGRLQNVDKVRGRKASIRSLVERLQKEIVKENTADQVVTITHGDCEEDAQQIARLVQEKTGITQFIINPLGPVIGSHTGPDMLAVFFLGEEDR